MLYISKSDYKSSHECPTKLYYKKNKFPSSLDADEYMKFLAKGGYAVGKLATLYYPEGIEVITCNPEKAIEETNNLLKNDNVTIFEAAILSNRKLIRVDILEKKGNHINLIEVKSKSYDPRSKDGLNHRSFNDYIFDVGFQYLTLKERFPEYKIIPYFFLPDKSRKTDIEGLSFYFYINEVDTGTNFRKYEVTIDKNIVPAITNEKILSMVNAEESVKRILPQIEDEVKVLLESMENGISFIKTPVSKKCFACEYTVKNNKQPQSGFDICWKDMQNPAYHIKDIGRLGQTKAIKNMDNLISKNLLSFDDIANELDITKSSDIRRKIQIDYTKADKVYFNNDLKLKLSEYKYPLHFIDFETSRTAIPFHKGMHPYEQIAFQWSCHTIHHPGDEPVHYEWLNLKKEYPNFEFAESLMEHIGNTGTPLIWSPFENTALKDIYRQIKFNDYKNIKLILWLEDIIKFNKRKEENEIIPDFLCETDGRLEDMHKLTKEYYFHPYMKGKTSIKKVLPAVLSKINSERITNWLKNFEIDLSLYSVDSNNSIINPYELLPPLEIYDEAEAKFGDEDEFSHNDYSYVNEGTGAMTAYQDIMIGLNSGNPELIKTYEQALKRYCKLDTLAMVIIWEYWKNY